MPEADAVLTAPAPMSPDEGDAGQRARSLLGATLRNGTIYSIGVVLSRLVGFLMLPLYTHLLTPADYGILELLSMTTDITAMVAGLGISWAVLRYYPEKAGTPEAPALVSTALILLVVVSGVLALGVSSASTPLALVLFGTPEHSDLLKLALTGLVLGAFVEVPVVVLNARQQPRAAVGVGVIRLFMALSLNILFLVGLDMGVAGIFWSTIATSAIVGGTLSFRLLRDAGLHFSPVLAKQLVRYGAPLVLWSLSSFVLHYSDRYFLRASTGLDEVGRYSLAYKLAMLLATFVGSPFETAWVPKAVEVYKRDGEAAGPVLQPVLRYYNLLLVTAALVIALFGGEAIVLATADSYHGAVHVLPMLALAMVLFSWRQISQLGATLRERSEFIALSSAVAAVAALGLNAVLVPRWHAMGAAVATALAFAVEASIMFFLSSRLFRVRLSPVVLLGPLGLAALVWVGANALAPWEQGVVVRLAVKASALPFFLALLVMSGLVTRVEWLWLSSAIRAPRALLANLRG
jgi:O-antigen/teichoic acid export membrane protein